MNKRTLTALIRSRNKWVKVWKHNGVDKGAYNCSLCTLFHPSKQDYDTLICVDCSGCPVAEKVGDSLCQGTPYNKWAEHFEKKHVDVEPFTLYNGCKTCENLAKTETLFLDKLLPKEHQMFTPTGRRKRNAS